MSAPEAPSERLRTVPPPSSDEEELLTPPPDTRTDTGALEGRMLSQGKTTEQLRQEAVSREHDRSQKFKDHFEVIAIIALWVSASALFLASLGWLWHLVAPVWWHFLSGEQVAKLQNLFTGGIIAGLVATHVRKRLGAVDRD